MNLQQRGMAVLESSLLSFTRTVASAVLVEAAVAGQSAAHVKLEVASFVSGLGFVSPNFLALRLHGGTLAIKAIASAIVATDQVLDIQIGRAFA